MAGIGRKHISRACGPSAFDCRFGHNCFYAVLAGIEVIKLKMNSVSERLPGSRLLHLGGKPACGRHLAA
jgi:hypothetical protein